MAQGIVYMLKVLKYMLQKQLNIKRQIMVGKLVMEIYFEHHCD